MFRDLHLVRVSVWGVERESIAHAQAHTWRFLVDFEVDFKVFALLRPSIVKLEILYLASD
jgi:hypothetical protein